jgi:hypothetical protein
MERKAYIVRVHGSVLDLGGLLESCKFQRKYLEVIEAVKNSWLSVTSLLTRIAFFVRTAVTTRLNLECRAGYSLFSPDLALLFRSDVE